MALWKDSSQAAKEAAAKDLAAKEAAAKEAAARETAAKEAAAKEANAKPEATGSLAVDSLKDTTAHATMTPSNDIFTAPAIATFDTATATASTISPRTNPMSASVTPIRDVTQNRKESILTEELTIEGKIEGSGNVRIAGKFKGDVNVQGNLVIEQGATVTGSVRALTITIAGQLEGNIEAATRVELLESGVLNGDVTAESLTVAAGSRMRGKADFGWTDKKPTRTP